mgnify:CR=1 FL=1
MAKFKFYQDKKYTFWERTSFTVEAPNETDAAEKASSLARGSLFDAEVNDPTIEIDESVTLYDTGEEILPDENGGEPTVEIYTHAKKLLADNRP